MNTPLPSHEIETRLKSVRSMIRRTQRTRAIFLITTVAIVGLLLVMAADLIFAPLPSVARWALFVVWIVALVMVSLRALAPLFRELPLIRIARWLEERHPEMQERLSTVLELSGPRDGVSTDLLDEIAKAAGRDIGTLNAHDEVRSARKRRLWKAPALFAAGLLILVLVAWPQSAMRLLLRAIAPFSDVGNAGATEFQIKPGNIELLEGDALNISFTVSKNKLTPQLRLETPSAGDTIQPVTAENGNFAFTLDPVKETIRYQVLAGRSQSDTFTATVLPMPVLTEPSITLEYPSYTALPKAELDPAKGVQAVAGTRATLTASINTELESAWIEMNGKRIAEGKLPTSAHDGKLVFNWLLDADSSGEAFVVLSHKLRKRIETLRFQVQVTGDKAPEVAILSPANKELRVRPEETVMIRHEIIEDYGLSEVSIELEAAGQTTSIVQTLPARFGSVRPPHYRGDSPLVIGTIRDRYPKIQELRVRIAARDTRSADLGGPGIGHSEWITLRIDEHTESLARQELRSQREEARKTIDEAINEIREAKQEANRSENDMRKESPPKEAAEHLEKAAEKLAKAEEKTSKLAEELTESLHAAKADKVEDTSEKLTEVREKIENVPLQEKGEQRGEQLREADKQIEEAISQLEKVRDEIERDQQRAEDVVDLKELADRQNELARQAESKTETAKADTPADPQPDKQWSEEQKQVAQKLQQEVAERADAKAEALKAQAEKARDLAEKAKELAEAQDQLGKDSKQLADNKTDTKPPTPEALAENQENQAEAASDLAEEIKSLPSLESNGPTQEATQAAQEGAKAAEAAAGEMAKAAEAADGEKSKPADATAGDKSKPADAAASESSPSEPSPGNQPGESTPPSPAEMAAAKAAAPLNERAGQEMAKSAAALEKAAEQFEQAAQAAAAQAQAATPPQGQAQAPAAPMAAALEAAAEAATTSDAAVAAEQSAAAAQALAQAAAAAQASMKGGKPSQGPPGVAPAPGPPQTPSMNQPTAEFRKPEADPGLPPELAKLGISAADWERIKATLGSDVGASETEAIPAEYRALVKDYFQNLTKPASEKRKP